MGTGSGSVCGPTGAVLAALVCGCQPRPSQLRATPRPVPEPTVPAGPALEILSAHVAMRDAPTGGGGDLLPVVFSVEVDPMGVTPERFSVVRRDGRRVAPRVATLAPASEWDENRTVLLVGDFTGGTPESPEDPTHVHVIGRLYAEDGRSLRGLGAEIQGADVPGTVVVAERVAVGPRRCEGATRAVRLYWSDGLRDVGGNDLQRIVVGLGIGDEVHPVGFDDHGVDRDDTGEDNVLDLCLDVPGIPVRVRIEAGVFSDPAGRPSGPVDVQVGEHGPVSEAVRSAATSGPA